MPPRRAERLQLPPDPGGQRSAQPARRSPRALSGAACTKSRCSSATPDLAGDADLQDRAALPARGGRLGPRPVLPGVGAVRGRRRLRRPELAAAWASTGEADQRIKFRPVPDNGGISAASNRGLAMCAGECVGFLDHDDTLTPDALLRVVQALESRPRARCRLHRLRTSSTAAAPGRPVPQARLVAGLRARGDVHRPPAGRAARARRGGRGFDSAFDKIQDFEFLLRVSERTDDPPHPPDTLPLARDPGRIAAGAEEKSRRRPSCRRAR